MDDIKADSRRVLFASIYAKRKAAFEGRRVEMEDFEDGLDFADKALEELEDDE